MIATLLVFQQLRFVQKKALGYDKDHLAIIPYPSDLNENLNPSGLSSYPIRILKMGRSSRIPTGRFYWMQWMPMLHRRHPWAPSKVDIKLGPLIMTLYLLMVWPWSQDVIFQGNIVWTLRISFWMKLLRLLGWPDASKAIGNEFKIWKYKRTYHRYRKRLPFREHASIDTSLGAGIISLWG